MRNNLLKKEIEFISTEDLNIRYCYILDRAEKLEAKDIPVADAREILRIEDELHRRLIKAVGHEFYPPDRIEKKPPINYIISPLKLTKPEPKPSVQINFPVTVISSVGTKVATFNVKADSKAMADILARKQIRKLGLTGARHKIS